MPPLLIGGAISAAGSILSGLLGANASSTAAQQQAAAGGKAASGQQAAGAAGAKRSQRGNIDRDRRISSHFFRLVRVRSKIFRSFSLQAVTHARSYSNFSAPNR